MTPRCEPMETLRRAAALPPGDPRRDHVDACPRCAARLAAMEAFLADGAVPAGADPADAERRLAAALAAAPARRRSRWGAGLLALAAVLALAALGPDLFRPRGDAGVSGVLRGEPAAGLVGLTATRTVDGLQLAWLPVPEADDYRVTFLDATLAETGPGRLTGGAPDLLLPPSTPHPAFWQVTALRRGDALAVSAPAVVPAGP